MSDTHKNNNIEEIDVKDLILKVLRKWYAFVIAGILCLAFAIYYILSTPPQYTTSGTVLVRSNNTFDNLNSDFSMASDLLDQGKLVDDEMIILKSKSIKRKMVEELDLQTDVFYSKRLGGDYELYHNEPLVVIYPQNFKQDLKGAFTINVKKDKKGHFKFKFTHIQNRHKTKFKAELTDINQTVETPWGKFSFIENEKNIDPDYKNYKLLYITNPIKSRIEQYDQTIQIALSNKKANAINISIDGGNQKKNEAIVNKIIELYDRDAVIDKNKASLQMANFISERIKLLNEELAVVEKKVEDYRLKNNIANISEQARIAMETTSEYDKLLANLDMQYSLLTFVDNFVKSSNQLELIPSNTGISDESLSNLIINYNNQIMEYLRLERSTNEENPFISQLKNKITLTRENILQTISNVKEGTLIKKQDIIKKNKIIEAQINTVPTIEREYLEIGREQGVKRNLYLFLLQKREEVQLALASTTTSGKVVDAAYTTEKPVSPNKKVILLIAMFMACALGALYIYLDILINNKIENKEELKKLTKLPVLSSIPLQKHMSSNIVMIQGENNIVSDAFRNLRINLKFTLPNAQDNTILITSSHSGEGKSFIAINLAISLAMINKKVALLGLDIRLPRLADYIQGIKHNPGITDYLSEPAFTEDDIVQKYSANNNLDVFVAGSIPPNPSELLTSARLNTLFEFIKQNYDYVIIDSAPIGLTSDTMQLVKYADSILYVCRQKVTQKQFIKELNNLVEEGHIKNVSLILNGAKGSKGYGYGYGYGQQK